VKRSNRVCARANRSNNNASSSVAAHVQSVLRCGQKAAGASAVAMATLLSVSAWGEEPLRISPEDSNTLRRVPGFDAPDQHGGGSGSTAGETHSSGAPGAQPLAVANTAQVDDQLQEVVVSGQRAALETAQHLKQFSPEIVDSIVAEDIGKLPDSSVTEVLQRVVGVEIDHTYRSINGVTDPEHFQVEGSGVTVRGLSYVRSEINGRDVFTANGGRALSFEDLPPELLAAVDVYKNPSAVQIEGAIGGLVNLRTAMPFDFQGSRVSASASGNWGDLSRGSVKPAASALFSDRWQTEMGEFGALVDLAYSEITTRTDGIEQYPYFPRVASMPHSTWIPAGVVDWVPDGGITWRTLRFKRTRDGVYGALQWRPSDNVLSSLTYFWSSYKFHWDENAIFPQTNPYNIEPAPGTNFTFSPSGVLTKGILADPTDGGLPFNDDTRSADRHSATSDLAWNLRWDISDRFSLSSDLQLVRSNTNADDFTVATGVNVSSESLNLTGSIPQVSIDQSYLTNPSNYYWAFTQDGVSRAYGKEWSWREDAQIQLGEGFFQSIRAGARVADRSALTELSEPGSGYNWAAISQSWMLGWYEPTLAYLNNFPAPHSTYAFPNFFNGGAKLPAAVVFPAVSLATGAPNTFAQLQSIRTVLCKQVDPNCNYAWTPGSLAPAAAGSQQTGGTNSQDEREYAGYFNLHFGSRTGAIPWDGDVGVRIVGTHDNTSGFVQMSPFSIPTNLPAGQSASQYVAFGGFVQPQTAQNNYTDVLPSLNVRFHLTDRLQARLAVSQAMARPDFSQLQAFTSLTSSINTTAAQQSFTGTANGNPNLKPTRATQLDTTLEWYFAPTGSVTAALFYKHLTDVVINQVFDVTATDTVGGTHTFTTTGPINGASGQIKGLELAYQQYYDFLPSLLRGFGTQLNFTYIDSSQTLDHPVTGKYCDSSSGSADNLALNLNGCDTNGLTFGNLPLVNLSKYAYNASLLYDRGPVSGRLAYSWRSKYLLGVNVNPAMGTNGTNSNPGSANYGMENVGWGLPLYAAAYGELDASLFFKVTSQVTVGFEARNLTDSLYKELQEQHVGWSTLAWYDSGRRYSAQFRVTL
jgi:TonB-dependent receptor